MRQSEYHVQVAVVQWFRVQYPDAVLTISPSGMKLSMGVAIKMKRAGYLAGTPDLLIFYPVGHWAGCFIELKTDEGRPSSLQLRLLARLRDVGYFTSVCYGFEEAVQTIKDYMENKYEDQRKATADIRAEVK